MSLSSIEIDKLRNAVPPPGQFVSSAVVRLYDSNGSQWVYTKCWGAAVIVSNGAPGGSGPVIRIMDPVNAGKGAPYFEFVMPNSPQGLSWSLDGPTFCSFNGVGGKFQAFSFVEESEAQEFTRRLGLNSNGVWNVSAPPAPPPRQAQSVAPPPRAQPAVPVATAATANSSSQSGIFGGWFGGKKEPTKKLDKSQIGAPTGFRHISHIGYTKGKGFDSQNIPPEWKAILEKAGVTEAQLQDPKQAKVIAKFMEEHGGAVPDQTSAPPVAPRPSTSGSEPKRRAPPPPPTSRRPPPPPPNRVPQTVTAAAPPPTPSRDNVVNVPPPPPPPPPVASSGGGPPPPPPPPSFGGPPPPPPPPSGNTPSSPMPPSSDGRNDLMAAIRGSGGASSLKPAQASPQPPASPSPSESGGGDLASALAAALAARQKAMTGDDEEDAEEEDDEEWK